MTQEENTEKNTKRLGVSRREFITGTVGGVVVGAVVGAAAGSIGFPKTITQYQTETQTSTTTSVTTATPWLPAKWDQAADVVVVGYGGAGAAAAISAYDAGASVIILEKTPSLSSLGVSNPTISGGGGNTQMDAGNAVFPMVPDQAAQYLYSTSLGTTPMDVCQAWATVGSQNPAWLDKMGIAHTAPSAAPAEFASAPGAAGFGAMTVTGGGSALFAGLDKQVQNRKIPILFSTSATGLVQNAQTREVLGVTALSYPAPASGTTTWNPQASQASTLNIKANKAVILATGGFEYSEKMKANYLKSYPAHFYGWQYNTGDGVSMAQAVGADLWHMNVISARMVPWFPDYPIAYSTTAPAQHGWIYVDKYGSRYADETQLSTYSHNWWMKVTEVNLTVPEYSRVPSFIVFDETCRKAASITSTSAKGIPTALGGAPAWSSDNSAEIAKGWIIQGSTPQALATAINSAKIVSGVDPTTGAQTTLKMNMDPNALAQTISTWNGYVAAKSDAQFGRSASTLVAIQTAPFYAMPLWPGGPNTLGGPRRNAKAQVVDTSGNPIPRLYENGELGAIDGWAALGQNNGCFIAFGQISGQNAAAEKAWS